MAGVCDEPVAIRLKNFGHAPATASFPVMSDLPGAAPNAPYPEISGLIPPAESESIDGCAGVYTQPDTYDLTLSTAPTIGVDADPTNNNRSEQTQVVPETGCTASPRGGVAVDRVFRLRRAHLWTAREAVAAVMSRRLGGP